MTAALMNADIAAHFLQLGGHAAYLFGYAPARPYASEHPCGGQGNMMLFESDLHGQARAPMPTFFGAQLLTTDWAGPGKVDIYNVSGDERAADGRPWVKAYAVLRADGRWSVLILNRDPDSARAIRIDRRDSEAEPAQSLAGPAEAVEYGAAQYDWPFPDERGGPSKDRPPSRVRIGSGPLLLTLAPYSITVVTTDRPATKPEKSQ